MALNALQKRGRAVSHVRQAYKMQRKQYGPNTHYTQASLYALEQKHRGKVTGVYEGHVQKPFGSSLVTQHAAGLRTASSGRQVLKKKGRIGRVSSGYPKVVSHFEHSVEHHHPMGRNHF